MFNPPKTLEEARKYRYGAWAGSPEGQSYTEGYCAYEVLSNERWSKAYQCQHKNGKGINGLYCGIHAKMVKID